MVNREAGEKNGNGRADDEQTDSAPPTPMTVDWLWGRMMRNEKVADERHKEIMALLKFVPTTGEKRAIMAFIVTLVGTILARQFGVSVPVILP